MCPLQAFVQLVWFIFKLNLKWLVALQLEILPVMTLWAWEKIKLSKRSLVWWIAGTSVYVKVSVSALENNWEKTRFFHHPSTFLFKVLHLGNVNSWIKTRALQLLYSLIAVQIPLKIEKIFRNPYFFPNAELDQAISQRDQPLHFSAWGLY